MPPTPSPTAPAVPIPTEPADLAVRASHQVTADDACTTARHYALIAFGIALVLRVAVVLWLNLAPPAYRPHLPIFAPDSAGYDMLAKNLLGGRGYEMFGDYREYTRIPPLFSAFLACLYALWRPSVIGTGLANALLGALTAVVLFAIVRDAFTALTEPAEDNARAARIGFIAALMFAVYPLEIFNTPYVLKENFSIFLTAVFVWAWVRLLVAAYAAAFRHAVAWATLCGLALGLSVLSRYTHIGLAVALLGVNAWLAWRYHRRAGFASRLGVHTVLTLIIFGLTLSPWLIRNYNLFGQVVLSSHGPARYLYTANADVAEPETSGYFEGHGGTEGRNLSVDAKTGHDIAQSEQIFARDAAHSIASSPVHFLQLVGAKIVCMWRPVWAGSALHTWIILGGPYIAMMLLALRGLIVYRGAARAGAMPAHPALAPVVGTILFYVLGHMAFYGMIRERQYVEPYLMAFAAYGVWGWLTPKVQQGKQDGNTGRGDQP